METRWRFFVVEALKSLRGNFATTIAAVVTVLVVMFIAGIGIVVAGWQSLIRRRRLALLRQALMAKDQLAA